MAEMKMQSATPLVISRRMLPQRTSIVNSKDVHHNREVGRHNPVQQQKSSRSSHSQNPSPSPTRCNVSLAIWLDSHFPELEHSCVPGLKSLAYLTSAAYAVSQESDRPGLSLRPDQRVLPE